MELKCKFEYQEWSIARIGCSKPDKLYTCVVEAAKIVRPGTVIRALYGDHLEGKSHKDIEALEFDDDCLVKYFPRGIQNIFPRLRGLGVSDCQLTIIARSDLEGLQSLEALHINSNQLKSLPSNLLVGMNKLKVISFRCNQIESMSSDILKPVLDNGLWWVDFEYNRGLHAFFQPGGFGTPPPVASIEELMKIIDEKCTKPTESLEPDQHEFLTNSKESFTGAVSELWDSKKFADFTVNAGSKKFRVHKFVLAMQCFKFYEMFEDQKIDEVDMADIDVDVVEAFLRYLYTGKVPNDANFIRLFKLSSRLDVPLLKTYCERKMLSNLRGSNAVDVFKLSHSYGKPELKEQAFEAIRKMMPDVEVPDGLMEKPEELKKLMQRGLESLGERIAKM